MKSVVVMYSVAETVLLDCLADGQWHPTNKLWKTFQENVKNHPELTATKFSRDKMVSDLNHFVDSGMLIAGANESYRFITKELEMWRLLSTTLDQNNPLTTPRYFGNILEDDGWQYAPLKTCHLVHFKTAHRINKNVIAQYAGLSNDAITVNEEGLYKIYSYDKEEPYNSIQRMKLEHPELGISGIRLEANLKRRDVKQLPKRYYAELCAHYGEFAKILLRSQMTSIIKHLPEQDDRNQQIFIWVIDAVKRYDDSTSIPFAAYLGSAIKKWVYDLNRKAHGRSIADTELKYNRAANEFRAREHREPTHEELATELGVPVAEVLKAKENISTVVNLRNQKAIDYDDYEVPLPAEEVTDQAVEDMIESTILSASITTASKEANGRRNMAGLVGLYYRTWGHDAEDKRIRSWSRSRAVNDAVTRLSEKASTIIQSTRQEN